MSKKLISLFRIRKPGIRRGPCRRLPWTVLRRPSGCRFDGTQKKAPITYIHNTTHKLLEKLSS